MYWVYFRGASSGSGENIEAANLNSAKWLFARKHNLNSIVYIAASFGRKS